MDILIAGAGSLGVAMGATLCAAGCAVSLYARGETKNAIAADGLHRRGLFGDLDEPAGDIAVSDDLGSFGQSRFDYILISVKTLANGELSEALAAHREILKPNGKLIIMQNGWGNDAAYLKYFPPEQVCCARVITGFQRTAPNISTITVHTAPVLLGSLNGLPAEGLAPLAEAISAGGIPCETTEDIGAALWAKMIYNCALNPLGAVLGLHYGALMDTPASKAIMDEVIDEIFAVMHAAGYRTYWDSPEAYKKEFYGKLVPDTYNHNSSTLQDIRKKHPTEIATLTGKIIELGREHNIPTPVNTMLFRLIRTIEANYRYRT